MRKSVSMVIGHAALIAAMAASCASAAVKTEKIDYSIYGESYKLSNGVVEVIATSAVGPRIICYRFVGGKNILAELDKNTSTKTELGEFHVWGGHRFWHAPEAMPRTYEPDDQPVKVEIVKEGVIRLTPPMEANTKIQKEIVVRLNPTDTGVTITHKMTNKSLWPVELAPWGLTIMDGGGMSIIPNEPFIKHEDALLPARPMVLWHYTDLSDPRWTFGKKFIRLQSDPKIEAPQKIGVLNKQSWMGYLKDKMFFLKQFRYDNKATYADYGCNCETYTAGSFIEVESMGPLVTLQPGASVSYVERWSLFKDIDMGNTDDSMETAIKPLLAETGAANFSMGYKPK